jgi:hypothetical protein
MRFARFRRWRPGASKCAGSSQRSNLAFSAGHSLSRIEFLRLPERSEECRSLEEGVRQLSFAWAPKT